MRREPTSRRQENPTTTQKRRSTVDRGVSIASGPQPELCGRPATPPDARVLVVVGTDIPPALLLSPLYLLHQVARRAQISTLPGHTARAAWGQAILCVLRPVHIGLAFNLPARGFQGLAGAGGSCGPAGFAWVSLTGGDAAAVLWWLRA